MNRFSRAIEARTGLRMPYFEQEDSSGIPLVLVHAVGDSQRVFEGVLAHLPASVHAFAPTMRGHGDAGRPRSGYRSSDFAADLAAFMDAVDLEAAVIAGGSSGGLVAQRFAIDFPDRIRGLVLLGAPLTLGNKPFAQRLWTTTISKLTDSVDPAFVRGFVERTLSPSVSHALLDALVQESLKVPAFVWRETLKGILEDDFSAELGRIAVPTLAIWGDGDSLIPREDQEALVQLIPGARRVVYPGAGHVFYLEDPVRAAADLTSFAEEACQLGGAATPDDGDSRSPGRGVPR
jgi:non-heme chloroperoxidase